MIDFVCDTCGAVKQVNESWLVGLAAEAVGAVSARREVNIQSLDERSFSTSLSRALLFHPKQR
jgi:hypothetical protein